MEEQCQCGARFKANPSQQRRSPASTVQLLPEQVAKHRGRQTAGAQWRRVCVTAVLPPLPQAWLRAHSQARPEHWSTTVVRCPEGHTTVESSQPVTTREVSNVSNTAQQSDDVPFPT